ncbi:MAG: hypothetical protein ACREJC_17245 [Tepidisphaeraceae bacterium]
MMSKTKVEKIPTRAALATLVERHPSRITEWLRHPEWSFPRQPPWPKSQVPSILRWAAEHLDDEGGRPADEELGELRKSKLRQEIRRLTAMADAAEMELSRERGKLLDGKQISREWGNVAQVVRNSVQGLPAMILPVALRNGMPNTGAVAFQREVQQIADDALSALSRTGDDDDD